MNQMLAGAIAALSIIAGLVFLRFWRSTHDRFFLFFTAAFWIEGLGRILLSLVDELNENLPVYYLLRLLAYGLILYAVIDKNRPGQRQP